jgi:perosamine synthetase
MPNLNAALGLAQIEILEDRVHKKRRLYAEYAESFSRVDGVSLFSEPTNARSNYWLQTLILDEKVMGMRDLIIEKLIRDDILVRSAWNIISDLVPYKNVYSGELNVAHNLSRRIINIPSSPQIMVD